jgi:hypothetical protein
LLQTETQNNVAGYLNIGASGGALAPSFPAGFLSIPDNAVWPYVQQWHLDIQHELPAHTVLTVAYVGSKGTHLGDQRDMNQMYPVLPSQNPYQTHQPITATDCNDITFAPVTGTATATPGPGTTYTTSQTGGWANNLAVACGNNANPYRPFYGMQTITRLENAANSSYHALQVAGRKSIGALNLTLAYTYSHSIDDSSDRYDGSFVNSYNLAQTRASSTYDQRHMLNIAWVYDLPFFKKTGLRHTLLGGWEWSGIETFYTGTPFSVTDGTSYGDNAGVGNGVGTGSFADRIGNPRADIPTQSNSTTYSEFYYNPGAYALPTGLTFGNSGRDSLPSAPRLNFDMGIFKHFAIKESTAFEFRVEAFNVFNHTQWWGPGGGMTCAGGANNSAGDPSCILPVTQGGAGANMFEIGGAHNPRILQLSAKFLF